MCGLGQVGQHTGNLNSFCEFSVFGYVSDPGEAYQFYN